MTSATPSLAALTARAQLGDRPALETLLRALEPGLRGHLRILLQSPSDADDALQETLWLVVRRLGTLRDASLVRPWAYRIATREATRLRRRMRKHDAEELADAAYVAAPDGDAEAMDQATYAEALAHIERLPHKAQVVVRLRFVDGLSQQEIAEALDVPLGTVKSRLSYGVQRLRALMHPVPSDAREADVRATRE